MTVSFAVCHFSSPLINRHATVAMTTFDWSSISNWLCAIALNERFTAFHSSTQPRKTDSLEFNIMGISDITSGLLQGVEISSGRSRGCPAVRTEKGFWGGQKGWRVGRQVWKSRRKISFFFSRQTLDFAKGATATAKFSPLFLNLLNHPCDPLLSPNRCNARFVFSWCYRIRYSGDLTTMNSAAHIKRDYTWRGFLWVSPTERGKKGFDFSKHFFFNLIEMISHDAMTSLRKLRYETHCFQSASFA